MSSLMPDWEDVLIFRRNLERLRLAANLGTNEAAKLCGISRASFVQLEAGNRSPSFAVLVKLKSGLKVSWADLLDGVADR